MWFIKVLKTECCNFIFQIAKKHQRYIKYNPKFYVKPARFLITLGTLDLKETRGMEVWHVQTIGLVQTYIFHSDMWGSIQSP